MLETDKKGVLYVEFAVVLPIFLLLMFNIIFGAIMLYDYNSAQEFVRIRARHIATAVANDTDKISYASGASSQDSQQSGTTVTTTTQTTMTVSLKSAYIASEKTKLIQLLNKRLLMYKVDEDFFRDNSGTPVDVVYRDNVDTTTGTKKTGSYIATTDNEICIEVKVRIYKTDDAVPFIASAICPDGFVIQQIERLEK